MPFGFWVLGNLATALEGVVKSPAKSQMPFGFWVLGNSRGGLTFNPFASSQMPFGFWVLGNLGKLSQTLAIVAMSQMPFGFWVLGNLDRLQMGYFPIHTSLKCLSAFGFWGTRKR